MSIRLVGALFCVEAAALWAMAWGGLGTPYPALSLWAVGFAAYLLAAGGAERLDRRWIWGGGIALRVGMFPSAPALSEDIYRYMWDGWVQRSGANPFQHAPAAPDLEALRTEWWPLINHADVPTIYPPGAQLVFVALAWIAPAWWIYKFAWLAADLAVAWLVGRLSRGRGSVPLLLYLWSPLLVVEVAWSGHFDPLGIAPMLGAVLLVGTAAQPAWRAGALLGLGASIKFAPLAAVPALWRRHGWVAAAIAVAIPVVLYLPFLSAREALFGGLRTYADVWEFNAGLYNALQRLPGPDDLAKWVGAAVVGAVVVRAAAGRWSLGRSLFWAIGAGLLTSPTIHPWYILWVLPFACLYLSRGWLLFSGTVFLAYAGRDAYLATGVWPEPAWLAWGIHGPPLALLAWDGWRGRSPKGLTGGHGIAERKQRGERDRVRDPQQSDVGDSSG